MIERDIHLGFMRAAITGLLSANAVPKDGLTIEQKAVRIADAALVQYRKRWEEQRRAEGVDLHDSLRKAHEKAFVSLPNWRMELERKRQMGLIP
jgi:hypothetical protein